MAYVSESERQTIVSDQVDVLVVGGGMAGCSAAIAAARMGAITLLVERLSCLGGTAQTAMVGVIAGLYTYGPQATQKQLIFGHAQELIEKLEKCSAGYKRDHRYHFDHSILKLILDQWLIDNNVQILLETYATQTLMNGKEVTGVIIENKSGRHAIYAKAIIDATGDGDIAAGAGALWEKGDASGSMQSPSYIFYLGGVEVGLALSVPARELREFQTRAYKNGEFSLNRISGSYLPITRPGVVLVNMTRTPNVDGLDPASVTTGNLEGRRQIWEYQAFLKKYVPGFENCYLDSVAPGLGIRETRRITGKYILTQEDVLQGRKFEDAICRCGWPIEDHTNDLETIKLFLPGDDYYQIPYRTLAPVEIDNLLIAGRCISATHAAHASVRVMGACLATGQAAGTGAAISITDGVKTRNVNAEQLQKKLRAQHVLI